jgi:hypothetical protein
VYLIAVSFFTLDFFGLNLSDLSPALADLTGLPHDVERKFHYLLFGWFQYRDVVKHCVDKLKPVEEKS